MKVTQMPPVHAANLVANSGNTEYGVDVIKNITKFFSGARPVWWKPPCLTHWSRVTHICVSELTIIGSDNGLLPGWRQAIIWTNDGILLIGPLGTNFSEILFRTQTFSFNKMHLKMSSAKWRPFCLGLNVLTESATR